MPPEAFIQGVQFGEPPEEAIFGYAAISIIYLVVSLLALLVIPRNVKLVAVGMITAAASVGYAGIVAGGAIVVAPTLMKLAVVLVIGGIATYLLDGSSKTVDGGAHD